jgi:hypothetical protein
VNPDSRQDGTAATAALLPSRETTSVTNARELPDKTTPPYLSGTCYTSNGQEMHFIKPEVSSPFSQKPATESYRGAVELSPHYDPYSFRFNFNIILYALSGSSMHDYHGPE